jgi:hypothetical protein
MYENNSSFLRAELDYRAARIRADQGRRLSRIRRARRPGEAANAR